MAMAVSLDHGGIAAWRAWQRTFEPDAVSA